jgi:hypothetical protein
MVFYIRKRFLVLASALVLFFGVTGRGEVIDKIVAVVEGRIITRSDVRQEREMRAQLNEPAAQTEADLTRQLADEYLLERQVADYPNTEVTNAEVDADIDRMGLPQPASDGIQEIIRRRLRIRKFVDLKFRPFIHPTEDEIRQYYETVFIPAARASGPSAILPLTNPEMAGAIRENIVQEKLTHELESWLDGVRKRSNVEFFD